MLAARQLFLERGYAAASMDAIAERTAVTKQTLYSYFSGKRALFMSVVEDIMGNSLAFDLSLDKPQTHDELRSVLYRVGKHINSVIVEPDYIQLLRVVVAEPGLGKLFERGITVRALRSLTTLFEEADRNGLMVAKHPATTAQFFMGGFVTRIFLQGLLMQSGKKGIRKQTKSELSQYVDEFLKHAGVM